MKALLLSQGSSINTPFIFESHFDARLKKMRVAYIAHAKDFLDPIKRRQAVKDSVSDLEKIVKSVDLIDLYNANKSRLEFTDKYDLIWVGEGMITNLHHAMFDTGFDQLLNELMASGMMYVGSSAGAMICSETLKVGAWYPNEQEPELVDRKGLGWIPYEIFPHYIASEHVEIIAENIIEPVILLPDNSAVGLDGSELRFYNQAGMFLN